MDRRLFLSCRDERINVTWCQLTGGLVSSQVQEEPEGALRGPSHKLHPDRVEHLQTSAQVNAHTRRQHLVFSHVTRRLVPS